MLLWIRKHYHFDNNLRKIGHFYIHQLSGLRQKLPIRDTLLGGDADEKITNSQIFASIFMEIAKRAGYNL